jgi:uncharacterized protein DUF4352
MFAMLVSAIALTLAACPSRNHDPMAGASALATPAAPLAWTVHQVMATHHLATSSLESKEAAPGNQFVVLDVSVRNRDADAQVLSEGKLIAMDESQLQTFDTPVSLLSDDYLGLQVLSPAQSMRGKIAYEVPEHLSGVLYWSPGNGSKRILLHVATPLVPQRTLASADADPDADAAADASVKVDTPPTKSIASIARIAKPVPKPVAADRHEHRVEPVAPSTDLDRVFATVPSPAAPATVATATVHAKLPDPPPQSVAPSLSSQAPAGEVAVIELPASRRNELPLKSEAHVAGGGAKRDGEQRRKLACQGLVSRNDPAEKPRSLGFFSDSCRDYALPSAWRPEQPDARRSLIRRVSSAIRRVVRSARAGHPVE